jgi:hypothetical protein
MNLINKIRKILNEFLGPPLITDDCGNFYNKYCEICGSEMQIVRPGKVQCPMVGSRIHSNERNGVK